MIFYSSHFELEKNTSPVSDENLPAEDLYIDFSLLCQLYADKRMLSESHRATLDGADGSKVGSMFTSDSHETANLSNYFKDQKYILEERQ